MHADINPDRPPEWLETKLRSLRQPPIPPDLESRLLASIPTQFSAGPRARHRWKVWIGVAGTLAAACLLAIFIWSRGEEPKDRFVGQGAKKNKRTEKVALSTARPSSLPAPDSIAAFRSVVYVSDEADMATFTWPVEEKSPVFRGVIPRELFE